MEGLLRRPLAAGSVVAAIDPGKASHRVLIADVDEGPLCEPVYVSALSDGIELLEAMLGQVGAIDPLFVIESTGALHRPWLAELQRRHPGQVRLVAPSETRAARAQMGARRFKTDDRDCAALVWLARQGVGRLPEDESLDGLLAAVRHRRQLMSEQKALRQRLHDQLNALCPGLSMPDGQGRVLNLMSSTGRAVLNCVVVFEGRASSVRSLQARAPGRLGDATARYWAERWRLCLPPPRDAALRADRLARDLLRLDSIKDAVTAVDTQIESLLVRTDGQVLTSLPGVAATRAAAFAVHSLPADRYPSADHLYSATGLAPSSYQSSSISKRGTISRQGLAEHRNALMGIAWGLSQHAPAFRDRLAEYRARGFAPMQARVALARHACRLCHKMLLTQQPYDETRYRRSRHRRGR